MKQRYLITANTSTAVWSGLWAKAVIPGLLFALAAVFAGCSSDSDASGDRYGSGTSEVTQDGGAAGDEIETDAETEPTADGITLSWQVRPMSEILSEWAAEPGLEGVEVCLIEGVDIPCSVTDSLGAFYLSGVPTNSELLLTFAKQGYVSYLASVRTGTHDFERMYTMPQMDEENRIRDQLEALGVVVDESKGAILLFGIAPTFADGVPGRLSISIDPPAGEGPFFLDNNAHIVPDATGLSESIIGVSFVNLEEGEYIISWEVQEPEDMSCSILGTDADAAIFGLPAEKPNAMRAQVRPGFTSGIYGIICDSATETDTEAES